MFLNQNKKIKHIQHFQMMLEQSAYSYKNCIQTVDSVKVSGWNSARNLIETSKTYHWNLKLRVLKYSGCSSVHKMRNAVSVLTSKQVAELQGNLDSMQKVHTFSLKLETALHKCCAVMYADKCLQNWYLDSTKVLISHVCI